MKKNVKIGTVLCSALAMSTAAGSANAKPVDLVLRLKERVSIETLVKNVTNPTSPRFRKYYTPEEIRSIAAPTDDSYQAMLNQLKAQGFTVVGESKTHLFVTVRADHSLFEKTFKTKMRFSRTALNSATPLSIPKPTVPAGLDLVAGISGLDQARVMRPHYHVIQNGKTANATTKDSDGHISQAQIKSSYGIDPIHANGINGSGQQIAVATFDGFHIEDIRAFFVQSNISPAPAVDQVIFNGSPAVVEDSAAETALDAEFSGMMAPGAKIHVFASNENSDAGEAALFTAILDDNRAQVINYSWGTCESQVASDHQAAMDALYARAAAQGVTILVASGDSGADGCRDGTVVADWPATEPYALAVGGTSFALDSSGNLNESAWSDGGGGVSTLYPLPAYQSNFQSPYAKRSMPDISFNADNTTGEQIWTRYPDGVQKWLTIGGTSMAAPQWAGILTLVNQARAQAGKSAIGFVNTALYAMPADVRAKALHDVTTGNNGFPAGPGWDAASGWGSPQANVLFDYLVAQ